MSIGPTIDASGVRVTTAQTLGNGIADVYLGTLDVPYYLSPDSSECHYSVEGKDGTEACPAISSRWMGYQETFQPSFITSAAVMALSSGNRNNSLLHDGSKREFRLCQTSRGVGP